MTERIITQESLKELLDYDPETGVFVWKKRSSHYFKNNSYKDRWNNRFSGKETGCISQAEKKSSYKVIRIFKKNYLAHRLAWLYHYGHWPEFIDHINHNGLDNRINNLRSISIAENNRNIKKSSNNSSGVTGVFFQKNRKTWNASIHKDSKKIHLGAFKNKNDAIKARKEAEVNFGYHENHGG